MKQHPTPLRSPQSARFVSILGLSAACLSGLSLWALAGPGVAPAVPGPGPMTTAAAGSSVEDAAEFKKKFKAAQKVNSKKEMEKLVRSNVDSASQWIIEVALGHKISPNPDKQALFDALKESWNGSIKTEFPMEMWRYYDAMDADAIKEYHQLEKGYNKLVTQYFDEQKAENGPDPKKLTELAARFESLAGDLAAAGCTYYESQAWSFAGFNFDEDNAKEHQDLKKACMAYHYMLQSREQIGLIDSLYKRTKPRYRALVQLGHGPEGSGKGPGNPEAKPDEPVEVAEIQRIPLEFAMLEEIDEFERPNYFADDHYQLWHSFFLREVGSEEPAVLRFAPIWERTGKKITAIRDSSSKIFIDLDGDRERGEDDVDVPTKGQLAPVHLQFEVDGKPRHVAFHAQVGQEKDQYQGNEINLQGSDTQYPVFASPGGTMQGTLGGETIRIIDEDLDGNYGGKPVGYFHSGMTKGTFHHEFDSMLIGKSKRALPYSRYVKVDKQWYDIKTVEDGTRLEAQAIDLPTGEMKLKFKGPKPTFMVLQGTGTNGGVLVDILASKTVEVPVGEYQLLTGMIAEGKKMQRKKILIIAGEETPTWTVEEGKTTEVELGGDFGFDFKADVDSKGCQVWGNSVCIVGERGERYERPYLCVPKPLAAARIPGKKRGSKPEKMGVFSGNEEATKKSWFPPDLSIDLKGVDGAVEVQLSEKKHPLFGKITSEWLPFD